MARRSVEIYIKGFNRAGKAFKELERGSARAFKAMRVPVIAIGVAAAGAATAYGLLIRKGVQYNTTLENFRNILTAVFKSQKRANEEMKWAIQFAAKTPFQIPQVVEATARLETYGITARKVLKPLGEMAAATGKSIMQAIEAFVDAQMGEWERLKEFGIKKEMLIPHGLEIDAKGAVTSIQSVTDALLSFMKKWEGQMDVMSVSFRGMVSNLRDIWDGITGILAKPLFDALKREMKSLLEWINKLRSTGRLDEILSGWGKAAVALFERFARGLEVVGPQLIRWLESSGKQFQAMIESMRIDDIKQWLQQIGNITKTIAKTVVRVVELTTENWKLIAAFTGLLIVGSVASRLSMFVSVVIRAIPAVKALAIANASLIAAIGPTGLILALIAVSAAITMYLIKRMDEARESYKKLIADMGRFTFKQMIEGSKKAAEAHARLRVSLEFEKKRVIELEAELNVLTSRWRASPKFAAEFEHKIRLLNSRLKAQKLIVKELTTELEGFAKLALPKALEREIAKPPPKRDLPKLDAVAQEKIRKQREKLQVELEKYTTNEIDFRIAEVERWANAERVKAKSHQDMLIAIDRIAQYRKLEIRKEFADKAKQLVDEERQVERDRANEIAIIQAQAMAQNLRNMDKETDARRLELNQQAQAIYEQLGATGQARMVAAKWLNGQLEAENKARLDAEKQADLAKLRLAKEAEAIILESQGRMKDAALARLDIEIQGLEEYNFTAEQLAAIREAKIVAIEKQYAEQAKNEGVRQAKEMQDEIFQSQKRYLEQRESSRQSAFEVEQERIRTLADRYETSTRNAMKLTNILSNVQRRGWLRTLAALIRFATQQYAMYLEGQALEKLKQAGDLQTQANWARAHAAKMAGLAAEAALMAGMYGAQALMGDVRAAAAAKAMLGVAKQAGVEALRATQEMGAFEVQARALQVEAAALMTTAVAVKAAGEVAASGLEMAADKADEAARRQEELLRKQEDRLREEERVQQRILELEGRTGEMRMRQLDEQIRAYEETGVSTALLQRLRALESAELMREEGLAVGGGGAVIVPTIPIATGGEAGPKNIIYQDVTFNALLDTAKEEDLRAWAEELAPYFDEIEERSEA